MDKPRVPGSARMTVQLPKSRRSGRVQTKSLSCWKGRICYTRKWESRSRSCPRRFSAGHSNQDWSENATQWRQISSGISVTHRGMVAGTGQLCAWTASKPDGYFRGVRLLERANCAREPLDFAVRSGGNGGACAGDGTRIECAYTSHAAGVTRSGPAGAAFGSLTRRVRRTGDRGEQLRRVW